jgi:putative Mn2+ efflux pump MntP
VGALVNVLVIAISLSLDALAVSIAGGVQARRAVLRDALKVGLFFGGFQAGMPLLGYLLGSAFKESVHTASGWIAFVLLALIGLNMIRIAVSGANDADDAADHEAAGAMLRTRTLLGLAVATSIDALVVGVTLSLAGLPFLVSIVVIGIVTFVISVAGFLFGKRLGTAFGTRVEILGGVALIAIGIRLLVS